MKNEVKNYYLVINNMSFEENTLTATMKNVTRLSDTEFQAAALDTVFGYGATLEFMMGSAVLVKASEGVLQKIQEECGDIFSYATVEGEAEVDLIRKAYYSSQNETKEEYNARQTDYLTHEVGALH